MALNGTMELIETVTVGSGGAANIDFQNIPQTYTDLVLKLSTRTNRANAQDAVSVYFNNDTTANRYTMRVLYGTGSAAYSINANTYDNELVMTCGGDATASIFGNGKIYIPNYAGSTQKSASAEGVGENNGTNAYRGISAYLYNQTTAITQITVIPVTGTLLAEHSTATLYGISKVPAIAKAYGGEIAYDSQYVYHAFKSSSVFTPLENLTVDYLVVAGGGGGGSAGSGGGGGGGAGGLRSTVTATGGGGSLESALFLTSGTNYTVTIGGGGAGMTGGLGNGGTGSNSVFSTITSNGGGGGARGDIAAFNGGSGGGGGTPNNGSGGTGTANQGFGGGNGYNGGGTNHQGAGGGGAGVAGTNGASNAAGVGGNGVQITALANPTGVGFDSGYFAGGGGGGSRIGLAVGASGGLGGGGRGGAANGVDTNPNGVGVAAIAYTGGGGGGGGGDGQVGANGGSGVVIVRYAK